MYEQYLYKEELLNTFGKDNQLVDNVKLQLREKIINKLKSNKPVNNASIDNSLIKKVCNTLIAQYMETQRYFHSLAVFSPEANFSKHHFSNEQLESIFKVKSKEEQSLFQAIVQQIMPKGRMVQRKAEVSVQTDDHQTITNLENRLSEVDFNFKQKMMMGLKNVEDSQVRFAKYKNEMNKRYKEQLQNQINRIRNFQIANIRMQEQEKNRLKIKELEEQLQNNYRAKMQKLREREAEVIQRVTTKMKEIQTYNYQARQRVLKEFQTMKAREQELDRFKQQLLERQRLLISKT